MTPWEAVLLGIVQGLTEFLPVSSSGHLVLGQALLGIRVQGVVFEVFVHFGTLVAVLTVFREDVGGLLKAFFRFGWLRQPLLITTPENDNYDHRVLHLVVGTLPVVLVGLTFGDTLESAFAHPRFAALMLLFTGLILLLSRVAGAPSGEMTAVKALAVGVSQVVAILPGISRSGITIATALFTGVNREEAVRFSFLLAIPAIAGAAVLKALELVRSAPGAAEIVSLTLGTVAAYFFGMLAIRWLIAAVRRGHLDRFGYYCLTVGAAGLFVLG